MTRLIVLCVLLVGSVCGSMMATLMFHHFEARALAQAVTHSVAQTGNRIAVTGVANVKVDGVEGDNFIDDVSAAGLFAAKNWVQLRENGAKLDEIEKTLTAIGETLDKRVAAFNADLRASVSKRFTELSPEVVNSEAMKVFREQLMSEVDKKIAASKQ